MLRRSLFLLGLGSLLSLACGQSSRAEFADPSGEPGADGTPAETFSPSTGGDGTENGASCATATVPITRTAIYMQLIVDGSGSMNDALVPGGPPGLKWKAASDALVSFFDDVASKKDVAFGVGLFLFDGTKGVQDFLVSDVPIRYVDAYHQTSLKNRIKQSTPQGGTPLKRALEGQIPILQSYTPSSPLKPNGKRVLVLITDGVPDGPSDIQPMVQGQCVQLVEDALKSSAAITTFSVGVGDPASDESTYNEVFAGRLAIAGGAAAAGCTPGWNESSPPGQIPCHFQVSPGAKSATQIRDELIGAIDAIRGAVTTCEFTLARPDGSAGVADPTRVNVVFTASDGKGTKVPQNANDGWTYDDPTNPTTVIFHGAACDRVKTEVSGKVDIELGCKTLVK